MLGWKELYNNCLTCNRCDLSKNRTHVVFGEGNSKADIMFIGEAPGGDEDKAGRPFVGKAGQFLTKMLDSLDLIRERDYYICNICKCRPENNRNPKEDEIKACIPYLRNQFALVKPKIIVCLGAIATNQIISDQWRITRDRGKWIERKGCFITATFHPAAVLRDEGKKQYIFRDLQEVRRAYECLKKVD
ncbi:uracil-DNA glycosylase [Clostridium tetani]|uniref:uracil-DNA glycosylase n=1 Tax=Clostridium tetani TaxID=1513 RepID=UPI00100AD9AE|nr:uracil-DNA glycosylase [Clostridium tetani]RXM77871.1 uracil-DNA glycosylase [Clostridium tetani]RYU99474.1 uracil-DNA glycosylase [Clostridium tetani]